MTRRAAGLVLGLTLGTTSPVFAQATRTWVSGVGDDVNPCSRTAPCKTFAGAISKTATGGEIDVIDPGGYGAVTITKSITIDGAGSHASILVSGTNAVIISGAAARVVLRNLSITGIDTGINGVRAVSGSSLTSLVIENCSIENFTTDGVVVEVGARVSIVGSSIRNTDGAGVSIAPASGTANVLLDRVHLENGGDGFRATGATVATIRDSSAAGNADAGFEADGTGVELNLTGATAASNANGVVAKNGARVRLIEATVAGNTTAGLVEDGGEITPFTENLVAGNPPGSDACQLVGTPVECPSVAPECPAPVCEAPVVSAGFGPCKRCRTKGGVTTCSGCGVTMH